jgi:hypothetical protein
MRYLPIVVQILAQDLGWECSVWPQICGCQEILAENLGFSGMLWLGHQIWRSHTWVDLSHCNKILKVSQVKIAVGLWCSSWLKLNIACCSYDILYQSGNLMLQRATTPESKKLRNWGCKFGIYLPINKPMVDWVKQHHLCTQIQTLPTSSCFVLSEGLHFVCIGTLPIFNCLY